MATEQRSADRNVPSANRAASVCGLLRVALLLTLPLILAGCSRDLHFAIRFAEIGGLTAGDPVLFNGQQVGKVMAIEAAEGGGHLVKVEVAQASAGAATVDSSFYLVDSPGDPPRRYIEIVQTRSGGQPLGEGAVVEGTYSSLSGLLPFGALLEQLGNTLGGLQGQVERFRQEFEKLPNSPEALKLEQEWRRLIEEIRKAQIAAEGALKKDVLPRLQKELEELQKKLQELESRGQVTGKPREI